jgi:hypothetical protein
MEPKTYFKITGIVLCILSMVVNMYFGNLFSKEAENVIYKYLYLAF